MVLGGGRRGEQMLSLLHDNQKDVWYKNNLSREALFCIRGGFLLLS
jgi:hypothetical protein